VKQGDPLCGVDAAAPKSLSRVQTDLTGVFRIVRKKSVTVADVL
jgi:hypothetical protein